MEGHTKEVSIMKNKTAELAFTNRWQKIQQCLRL